MYKVEEHKYSRKIEEKQEYADVLGYVFVKH